jgi:putative Mg2+ transporter-C (MgtC) family protein
MEMFLTIDEPYIIDPILKLFGYVSHDIEWYSVLVRLLIAALIGGIFGAERASKHHVAGLRTYIFVCLGACVGMLVNEFLRNRSDAGRIGAQVITGIGFLGAGSIIMNTRNQIRGITTASALWAVGAIGLAVGAGFYTTALFATLISIIVLVVLPFFEERLHKKSKSYDVHIELRSRPDLKSLLGYIRGMNCTVLSVAYDSAYANTGLSVYTITILSHKSQKKYIYYNEMVEKLRHLEYVNFVEYVL